MSRDLRIDDLRPCGYVSTTCRNCVFFDRCGGLYNNRPLLNCFDQFCCGDGSCDYVCPYKPADFQKRLREIGGLRFDDIPRLHQSPIDLPAYVPMVHHGYRRSSELCVDTVALDPYTIFRRRGNAYQSIAADGHDLRRKFRISQHARVILRATSEDPFLERYWSYRITDQVAQRISALNVSLVIGPNYSHFLDAPRTDVLYNRKRQLLCLAELSNAGVSVAPHLSANAPPDWTFWTGFLRENAQIRHVAMNFQTGYKSPREGRKAIDRIERIQSEIGRKLSILAVGGAQFVGYLAQRFDRLTLVDSHAFARSHRRRRFQNQDGARQWEETWTLERQPIDHILQANVESYGNWVAQMSKRAVP